MNIERYPRVAFLTDGPDETNAQLDAFATLHGLPFLTIRYTRGRPHQFFRLGKTLRDFRPGVVHAAAPGAVGLAAAGWADRLKIPLVLSWRCSIPVQRLSERIFLQGLYQSRGFVQILLAPNADIARILHRNTGLPARLIHPGIDTSLYAPSKRVYADGVLRIGYMGALS